jgi:hypothetical protein
VIPCTSFADQLANVILGKVKSQIVLYAELQAAVIGALRTDQSRTESYTPAVALST